MADDETNDFASPACFLHEIDPAYSGLSAPMAWADVNRWRKAERERLIAERLAVPADVRAGWGEIIAAGSRAVYEQAMALLKA